MAKKKDEIPEDVDGELKSPKFGKPNTHTNSGYILDINESDKKVDVQLYEPMSGTTILEGLELSKTINLNDLEKGVVCQFKLDEFKAPLGKKTIDYLKEQGITPVSYTHLTLPTKRIV